MPLWPRRVAAYRLIGFIGYFALHRGESGALSLAATRKPGTQCRITYKTYKPITAARRMLR